MHPPAPSSALCTMQSVCDSSAGKCKNLSNRTSHEIHRDNMLLCYQPLLFSTQCQRLFFFHPSTMSHGYSIPAAVTLWGALVSLCKKPERFGCWQWVNPLQKLPSTLQGWSLGRSNGFWAIDQPAMLYCTCTELELSSLPLPPTFPHSNPDTPTRSDISLWWNIFTFYHASLCRWVEAARLQDLKQSGNLEQAFRVRYKT